MSGWAPIDVDWWTAIAATLPLPWPREAILMDLRMWADAERMGRAVRPGRAALAKRWGASDWHAREALRSEHEWADPSVVRVDPPALIPPTPDPPPVTLPSSNGATLTLFENPPALLPNASTNPPALLPTRVEVHPSPTPTPTPKKNNKVGEFPEPLRQAILASGYRDITVADRAMVPKLLRAGHTVEDLVKVWNCKHRDPHMVGKNEHQKNYMRMGTPWRPENFVRYLAEADATPNVVPAGTYRRPEGDVLPKPAVVDDDGIPF